MKKKKVTGSVSMTLVSASAKCPRSEVRLGVTAGDPEEQGKPGKDARRGRCHLLE